MFSALIRGVFILVVVGWYSSGVWNGMNRYYGEQFKKYLDTEMEKNPKMKEHIEGSPELKNVFIPQREKQKVEAVVETKVIIAKLDEQLAVLNEMSKNTDVTSEVAEDSDDDQGVCSIVPPEGQVFGDDNQPCG